MLHRASKTQHLHDIILYLLFLGNVGLQMLLKILLFLSLAQSLSILGKYVYILNIFIKIFLSLFHCNGCLEEISSSDKVVNCRTTFIFTKI